MSQKGNKSSAVKKLRIAQAWLQSLTATSNTQIALLTGYLCSTLNLIPNKQNITALNDILVYTKTRVVAKRKKQGRSNEEIEYKNLIEVVVQVGTYDFGEDLELLRELVGGLTEEVLRDRMFMNEKWDRDRQEEQRQISKSNKKIQSQTQTHTQIKQEQKQEIFRGQSDENTSANTKFKKQDEHQAKRLKQSNQCQICLQFIELPQIGILSCEHVFHKVCIRGHIQALLNEKKLTIPCPSGCGIDISAEDLQDLIDGELKKKFDKFGLDLFAEKYENQLVWCPTTDCTAAFLIQEDVDNFQCPVCDKSYCLRCRCQKHDGMTCRQYRVTHKFDENDKKFEQFAKGTKLKQCPNCKIWVEKTQGCVSMKCRCGVEFCYNCGGTDCPHGNCKNNLKLQHIVNIDRMNMPMREGMRQEHQQEGEGRGQILIRLQQLESHGGDNMGKLLRLLRLMSET